MPEYGSVEYWDRRYGDASSSEPFDWLFDYNDVKHVLEQLMPDKSVPILMVGAGNAPFSPDMYFQGGYKHIINIDISSVVINQQQKLYPEQEWHIMDVTNMKYADHHFNMVVDKSLIDTLLCYSNSNANTSKMIDEIYRVMAPGSRYITFSLHSLEETIRHFQDDKYKWKVSGFNIKSSRWNEDANRRRAVAHCMIVCDKEPYSPSPLDLQGVLSTEDLEVLQKQADQVNLQKAVESAPTELLCQLLDKALTKYQNSNFQVKNQT